MNTNHAGGSLDNVVFENRNKNYGAYALRKDHDKRVMLAFFIASSVLFLSFYTPIFMKRFSNEILVVPEDTTQVWDTIQVDITPPDSPPKPPKPPTPPTPPSPTQALGTRVIDSLEQTDTTRVALPDDPEFNPTPFTGNVGTNLNSEGPGGGGEITPDPDPLVIVPDQMPEFPGGEAGRANFYSRNIIFPTSIREYPKNVTVYLSFIIEKDGSVSDVTVLRQTDKDCEREAIRITGKMPTWKPGMNNGHPVRVPMSLPVRFVVK